MDQNAEKRRLWKKLMRLQKIQDYLKEKNIKYQYTEEDDCGSVDFEYRGIFYNVWEFPEPERGAQANVRTGGRQEEFYDDYEAAIIDVMKHWQ